MRPYRWLCPTICRQDAQRKRPQTIPHTVRPQETGQRKAVCDRPSIMTHPPSARQRKDACTRTMMFAHGKETVSPLAAPPDGYGVKISDETRFRNFTTRRASSCGQTRGCRGLSTHNDVISFRLFILCYFISSLLLSFLLFTPLCNRYVTRYATVMEA